MKLLRSLLLLCALLFLPVSFAGAETVIRESGQVTLRGELTETVIVEPAGEGAPELILDNVRISTDGHCIDIRAGQRVTITIPEGTSSDLTSSGKSAIHSKAPLTVGGGGALSIHAKTKGITAKRDLLLEAISLQVESEGDAIHGDENIDIDGASLTLYSNEDAIDAKVNLTIESGFVTVERSFEGLEAENILIKGGEHAITAEDDGLNATFGKATGVGWVLRDHDPCIRIQGGTTVIQANGDGIDSNGDLFFDGGTVLVCGSSSSTNSALDAAGRLWTSGGLLIAVGARGMDRLPTDKGLTPVLFATDWHAHGSPIQLRRGDEIVELIPHSDWNSLVAAYPEDWTLWVDGAPFTENE